MSHTITAVLVMSRLKRSGWASICTTRLVVIAIPPFQGDKNQDAALRPTTYWAAPRLFHIVQSPGYAALFFLPWNHSSSNIAYRYSSPHWFSPQAMHFRKW